jgi:hypothetical protein
VPLETVPVSDAARAHAATSRWFSQDVFADVDEDEEEVSVCAVGGGRVGGWDVMMFLGCVTCTHRLGE